MKKHYMLYINTLWYLLKTDFTIFKRTIIDKIINLIIWVSSIAWVTTYLMPAFGLDPDYCTFLVVGLIASAGLFEVFSSVTRIISDLENINIISYYLTLPIPSWLIFLRSMIFYAFNSAFLGILILPICKLILGTRLDLSAMNPYQFLLIFIAISAFYGAFTLWIAARVLGIEYIGNVWMRFVYPLWYFGGFQFSWNVLYKAYPVVAYLNLLNPMTYIMEGSRAAILGQTNFLNFWICTITLALLTLFCGWRSIHLFKKRLDF